jgi:ribosomal protein L11 methyltransferase
MPPIEAEVLIANILAGPLMELAPRLTASVAPGGALALSGILHDQADQVAAAYATGFDLEPPRVREDWALIAGRRRDALGRAKVAGGWGRERRYRCL